MSPGVSPVWLKDRGHLQTWEIPTCGERAKRPRVALLRGPSVGGVWKVPARPPVSTPHPHLPQLGGSRAGLSLQAGLSQPVMLCGP